MSCCPCPCSLVWLSDFFGSARDPIHSEKSWLDSAVRYLSRVAVGKQKGQETVWSPRCKPHWWDAAVSHAWKNPTTNPKDSKEVLKEKFLVLETQLRKENRFPPEFEEECRLWEKGKFEELYLQTYYPCLLSKATNIHSQIEEACRKASKLGVLANQSQLSNIKTCLRSSLTRLEEMDSSNIENPVIKRKRKNICKADKENGGCSKSRNSNAVRRELNESLKLNHSFGSLPTLETENLTRRGNAGPSTSSSCEKFNRLSAACPISLGHTPNNLSCLGRDQTFSSCYPSNVPTSIGPLSSSPDSLNTSASCFLPVPRASTILSSTDEKSSPVLCCPFAHSTPLPRFQEGYNSCSDPTSQSSDLSHTLPTDPPSDSPKQTLDSFSENSVLVNGLRHTVSLENNCESSSLSNYQIASSSTPLSRLELEVESSLLSADTLQSHNCNKSPYGLDDTMDLWDYVTAPNETTEDISNNKKSFAKETLDSLDELDGIESLDEYLIGNDPGQLKEDIKDYEQFSSFNSHGSSKSLSGSQNESSSPNVTEKSSFKKSREGIYRDGGCTSSLREREGGERDVGYFTKESLGSQENKIDIDPQTSDTTTQLQSFLFCQDSQTWLEKYLN